MSKKIDRGFVQLLLIIVIIVVAIVAVGYMYLRNSDNTLPHQSSEQSSSSSNTGRLPSGFSIPFNIEDVDLENGEVNPLGVIRGSKDAPAGPYPGGHPGIDIPLFQGSEIKAVSEGKVVLIESAGDPWGGMKIVQLLQKTGQGEGWAYLYEHVTPKIKEGDNVKKGQVIATKTAPAGFTAHFQMSKVFNNYQYTQDNQCWPDFLSENESDKLSTWWNSYRQLDHLLDSWGTTEEEGSFPFRGLLDEANYPDGPQLCYPIGTDER